MARNLMAADAHVVAHSRSPAPVDALVAEGATAQATPAAVGRAAATVILMTTDTAAVEAVLMGPDGLLAGVSEGSLIIDMGTTAVIDTRRFAKLAAAAGAAYVDAPVSGGQVGAQQGNLTIMAGAADADLARVRPILEVLGARVTHVGAVGCGQIAKAANQVVVGLTIGAVAEALSLAKAAGADPARVREALRGGFADSRILDYHGGRMISGDFVAGGKVSTQRKDMRQAMELAAQAGAQVPATALSFELFDRLCQAGLGDIDHAGLYRFYDPGID